MDELDPIGLAKPALETEESADDAPTVSDTIREAVAELNTRAVGHQRALVRSSTFDESYQAHHQGCLEGLNFALELLGGEPVASPIVEKPPVSRTAVALACKAYRLAATASRRPAA